VLSAVYRYITGRRTSVFLQKLMIVQLDKKFSFITSPVHCYAQYRCILININIAFSYEEELLVLIPPHSLQTAYCLSLRVFIRRTYCYSQYLEAVSRLLSVITRNAAIYAVDISINPLNAELNPICHLLALLGGATIVVVSRLRVNVSTTVKYKEWQLNC
jgi:hypothetical protein